MKGKFSFHQFNTSDKHDVYQIRSKSSRKWVRNFIYQTRCLTI